jgi:hypothetical protein
MSRIPPISQIVTGRPEEMGVRAAGGTANAKRWTLRVSSPVVIFSARN